MKFSGFLEDFFVIFLERNEADNMEYYESVIDNILGLAKEADELQIKPYGYFYDNISRETDEFKELAEMRTAKPPIEIKDKPFGDYVLVCPYCHSRAIFNPLRSEKELYPNCPFCGQKLKKLD